MHSVAGNVKWAVTPDGIYIASDENPPSIRFYDFATQRTHKIFKADKDVEEGMSIPADGRYMLYSQIDETNADIMLVNNFR